MPAADDSLTPAQVAALDAIDATLAGEPIDPDYAEFGELALLLRDETPRPQQSFVADLDGRVARRFAQGTPAAARLGRPRWRWRPQWRAGLLAPAASVLVVAAVGGALAVAINHGPSSGESFSSSSAAGAVSSASSSSASGSAGRGVVNSSRPQHLSAARAAASSAASSTSASASAPAQPAPGPAPGGNRQIVQSAQLQLSAPPTRIDDVAQQVFDVVAQVKGIVDNSNVTSTGNSDAGANFQLSVPSANLQQAITDLSQLHGATVVSRSDSTSDITGQVGHAGMKLAEARALRRSLLKQLAAATTTEQVTSLKQQIRDADASIASDLSSLNGLKNQVAYSKIGLSIQAAPPAAAGSSFTIGRAAHDAGRVLVVVAGAALIALAVLIPLALVGALLAWVSLALGGGGRARPGSGVAL